MYMTGLSPLDELWFQDLWKEGRNRWMGSGSYRVAGIFAMGMECKARHNKRYLGMGSGCNYTGMKKE